MKSFLTKKLRVTLVLSPLNTTAVFPGTNSNTLVITGLQMSVNIQSVPSVATNCDVRIYGMKREDMNALTVAFFNLPTIATNIITVEADSGDGNWSQVFEGLITEAAPEYGGAPNVFFVVQAIVAYQHQIAPVPPLSYPGKTSVADIVRTIAGTMGLVPEVNDTDAQLDSPYLSGTAWDQLRSVCRAANCNYVVYDGRLAIYKLRGARTSRPVVLLSPTTGLIGYPVLNQFGVLVRALFNPALTAGDPVRIEGCTIPNANGDWIAQTVNLQLDTTRQSAWFTIAQCYPSAKVAA